MNRLAAVMPGRRSSDRTDLVSARWLGIHIINVSRELELWR